MMGTGSASQRLCRRLIWIEHKSKEIAKLKMQIMVRQFKMEIRLSRLEQKDYIIATVWMKSALAHTFASAKCLHIDSISCSVRLPPNLFKTDLELKQIKNF